MLVYDLATRRKVHPATIWGGLVIVASQPLRLMIRAPRLARRLAYELVVGKPVRSVCQRNNGVNDQPGRVAATEAKSNGPWIRTND